MSVDINLPFGKFLRLSMAEYIRTVGGRDKISAGMTEELIDKEHDAWHAYRKPRPAARFIPPTPAEVELFSQEIGYPLDGVAWCLHYEVKGWHTGNAKMKNWHAGVRNWKRNGWRTKLTPKCTQPGELQTEPVNWVQFMRQNYPNWVEFRDGHAPTWASLSPQTKRVVIDLIEKESPDAPAQA
jgi:hypothetical protein